MLPDEERDIVEKLLKLLLGVMMLANPPKISANYASIESLKILYANLISLRDFLFAASNGDLSMQIPFKGYIAGTLKTLQANLRHLTWQTKMVASGDFSQRVEFMGEFSESFNAMVAQLDQTMKKLVKKESELTQTNEELLKEIANRKKIEIELRESEKELRLQAIMDSLTGLYNRRHFHELAQIAVSKSLRYSLPLSVVIYDIDFFKCVNDTFGHTSGDVVLKKIADITKKEVRKSDIPARYGGEEFILLLQGTSAQGALLLCERLRTQIENTIVETEDQKISVTASFGVSDYLGKPEKPSPETCERVLSEFISGADRALYVSKNAGRNRVTIYEPEEISLL